MKIDGQAILDALKAQIVPATADLVIKAVDVVLVEVQKQASEQPGDMIAGILAIGLPELKNLVDAELKQLAAKV